MKINVPDDKAEQFFDKIERFLLTLPEKEAEVFKMKCMHNKNKRGLSYKKIAQSLGLTEGEVRRLGEEAQVKFLWSFVEKEYLNGKPILH